MQRNISFPYKEFVERALAGGVMFNARIETILSAPFFAIITQAADEAFAPINDRMPLSLTAVQVRQWLDPQQDHKTIIENLAGSSLLLRARPIVSTVNNARNKDDVVFLDAVGNE